MAYVYRYLNSKDAVKYVGIVHGDGLENLRKRIKEHDADERFKKNWRIEYIGGLSRTDAETLEAHFINVNHSTCINVAKRNWGQLSFQIEGLPDWTEYDDSDICSKIRAYKQTYFHRYADEVVSYECSCCHREIKGYPHNYIDMVFAGVVGTGISLWLCDECEYRWAKTFEDFFAPITRAKIRWRPKKGRAYEDQHLCSGELNRKLYYYWEHEKND